MSPETIAAMFPRAANYHPAWLQASASGGANPLWLTEWLAGAMDLRPGMRVLDLGCGRAASSVFLHREFGVQVWATDLWFDPSENCRRIEDAGAADGVFPLRADARSLPFAKEFFDAVISIDSFIYYGTDDLYLNYLARVLRPHGTVGIAGAGVRAEFPGEVPAHLREWWEPNLWSLHSPAWWKRHWEKTGILSVGLADCHPDGGQLWLDWHRRHFPDNAAEIRALEADRGENLGYVRVIGQRRTDARMDDPVSSIPAHYVPQPLLRSPTTEQPVRG